MNNAATGSGVFDGAGRYIVGRRFAPTIKRMDYDYTAPTLAQPTPDQVRATRLRLGHTQAAAAALVHRTDSARWREWERGGHTGRVIDIAIWELYLIKSGLRVYT